MLKVAFSSIYRYELPPNHRFPMEKYDLLPEQLLYEGTLTKEHFFKPDPLTETDVLRIHTREYLRKLQEGQLTRKEERTTGFPWSKRLIDRGFVISGGTLQGALFALEYGCSMNIAGGTHHAYADRGEGFCLLNDIAIASAYLLEKGLVKQILVVDLDVHQGNGTAKLFENEPRVFTFSMHGANNYPLKKEQSDLDVGLLDGTRDSLYLSLLRSNLSTLIEVVEPDFIFFQSGVDILESDKLGRLSVSLQGCKQRDQIVFEACHQNNIPVMVSMGGGYSPKISDIIEAHANTYRMAESVFF